MLPGCLRTLTELAMAYCVDGTISGARACGTAELRGGLCHAGNPCLHGHIVHALTHSPGENANHEPGCADAPAAGASARVRSIIATRAQQEHGNKWTKVIQDHATSTAVLPRHQ